MRGSIELKSYSDNSRSPYRVDEGAATLSSSARLFSLASHVATLIDAFIQRDGVGALLNSSAAIALTGDGRPILTLSLDQLRKTDQVQSVVLLKDVKEIQELRLLDGDSSLVGSPVSRLAVDRVATEVVRRLLVGNLNQRQGTQPSAPPRVPAALPTMIARSGVLERTYEIGRFKALLIRRPKAVGPLEYQFMLAVADDNGHPVLMISSERNLMTSALLKVAAKQLAGQGIPLSDSAFFLCVSDARGGRRNLGPSPDWEDIEKFAARAIDLAKEHVKVRMATEVYRRRDRKWIYAAVGAAIVVIAAILWCLR